MNTYRILTGDAAEQLRILPDASVHCVVTSPPYWALRDYQVSGQIGLEATQREYIDHLMDVFAQVWRVLRDDGTLWLNLGDSYIGSGGAGDWSKRKAGKQEYVGPRNNANRISPPGMKPKDLAGIPWRVAFALQDAGWYLRQDIIWHKPNPMPESVRDRCTKAHEYIFLLTKQPCYYYDADAIAETTVGSPDATSATSDWDTDHGAHGQDYGAKYNYAGRRNKRSVWTISPRGFRGAHFATFPEDIPRLAILAGTSECGCCPACGAPWQRVTDSVTVDWQSTCQCSTPDDLFLPIPCTVLDPFGGSGTTAAVAIQLGRDAVICELNPEYVQIARRRIQAVAPLFSKEHAREAGL